MRLTCRPTFMLAFITGLVFILGIEPPVMAREVDTESPIGSVGGAVHADPFTGMATMSIPIEVPPGRNGVQPNLTLSYASTNGNGWVGTNWKLEMGAIERSIRFGVDYTKNDYTIRLNGVSADLIQAPAPAPSDEYRAKLEGGFLRIKKLSSGGWEVTDTKGVKYLFGTIVTTRMADPADANRVLKWYLERVEDRDGNFMTVTYTSDQGQGYLDQVQYTGNGTTLPINTVKFYKENRPDASDMYTSNFRVRTAFRLKTIEVKANGNLVRVYKIEYDSGSEASILKTVQQVGRDASVGTSGIVTGGTAMPAFTITYPSGTASFTGPSGFVGVYGSGWQMGDVNGDGKADLVDASQVYLSTGNGWSAAGSWGLAGCGTPTKMLVGDINGDGKADVVCSYLEGGGADLIAQFQLSTGSGFTGPSGFVGVYGSGWQMGDVNGDGKADLVDASQVYLSTGNGWSAAGSWGLAGCGTPTKMLVGDINGDGKADVVCSYLEGSGADLIAQFQLSTTTAANTITFANGLGTTSTITFAAPNLYTSVQMPFPISTVSSIAVTDGNGNTLTTSHTFSGPYYYQSERDFRGFNYAKVTGPVGPNGEQLISETWFHQGNDVIANVNNPNVPNGYTKGIPYRTKIIDAMGRVYNDTTTTYVADADGVAPFFTPIAQVDASIDNGAKQTRTVYAQYDAYGNVLREDQHGDLSTTSDDRTVVRTFANNTTDWLLGFPTSETIYQGIGLSPQVAQTTFYYDGTTSCGTASTNQTPALGHLTRTVRWLNGGTNVESRLAYDAFGNLLCTRDANGTTTTLTYDSTNTFAKTSTNPLGHVITTQYYGVDGHALTNGYYGQVKSVTDSNNQTITTEYDALGRKTKSTAPDGLVITTTYNYGTGFTVGTQHLLTSTSGVGLASVLTSFTYFDGLGRTIKTESTGPDSKTLVTEVQYDARGVVRKQSLPYFKTLESVTGRWTTMNYDALGRVVRVDSPDSTRGLFCFSGWVTATIDAADHRKRETKDAYGRTVRVDEYQGTFSTCDTTVGTPYATTTYQYDVQGNLLSVTDAKGNVSTMTYDTLGRKIAMHDPDMGNWSYLYDADGNLTKQTDAKGQILWFQYDVLNRRVQKDFTTQKALGSGDVRYTYDGTTHNRKGRLQQVIDASGTVVFQYDSVGRITQTDKSLDGTTYTTQNTFDGLGRVLTVTYPSTPSKTISYAYNGPVLDKVFEGTTTYIQYTNYNALGQAETTTYGNGVSTTRTYANANNTLCSQQNFRLCTLKTHGPGSGGGGSPTGALTGSFTAPGSTVNLSTEGTTDWAHWGLVTASSFTHKSGVTAQISTFTALGGGTALRYDDNPNGYTWTGGTPTASATNSPTGLYMMGLNKGFQLTLPADTTARTVKLYVGGWGAQAKLEATLSDSSAAAYTEATFSDSGSGDGTNRVYTLTYQAASANQTLTVKWTVTGMNDPQYGNVSLQAATLTTASGGGGGGGGSVTTYNAIDDFSNTQGHQGWHYLSSSGSPLTWNGNFWSGSDGYIGLWDDGGHPGNSTDAVRRWVAPSAGSIQITGNTFDGDTSCGVDGVQVTIKKNGSVLWQQTIAAGDTTGYSFNLSITVAQNDQVDFVTNKLTTSSCDNTVFTPTIVLTTGGGSGSGTAYQDLRYVYTPDGNVSDIYDNLVAAGAGDQHLSYDSLDRLTLANGPYGTSGANASLTYTYDELGNLTFNTQVGTYTYPTSGSSSVRPHAVTMAGGNTYSYDANGNLTSGAGRSLTWNLENKPLTITMAGQTTTFVYDGDGGRVKKTAGSTVTRYISKLYECDNASCSRMVFAGGQRIATIGASDAIYYYHPDHLGSSSVITDSTGAKAQALTYYPYGATRTNQNSTTPAVDVAYKYTGKELDTSTNLYYYEARYYDSTLGRFLSSDSIVPNPRDPQDLNRYTYAGNNPFRYTDPTGHFRINFGKFFRRALGDVGTTALGVAIQIAGGPIFGAANFLIGSAVLTQSKSGRYTLAGEILAATAVASFACGGCGSVATASAIGAWTGAGFGGYSAAQAGGDISQGMLFGSAVGAVAGAVNGGISSAFKVASLGAPSFSAKFAWAATKMFGAHAIGGAVAGAAGGATVGYAGGAGNWDAIVSGTLYGAATGAALAGAFTGAEYYLRDTGAAFSRGAGKDWWKLTDLTIETLIKRIITTPTIPELALSVGAGNEVMRGTLFNLASGEIEKQLQKGGHCTYGSNGFGCDSGSGLNESSPPSQRGEPF